VDDANGNVSAELSVGNDSGLAGTSATEESSDVSAVASLVDKKKKKKRVNKKPADR
jgi:hypothetical protein